VGDGWLFSRRNGRMAERMGHSKASMSLDVYTHVMPPAEIGADELSAPTHREEMNRMTDVTVDTFYGMATAIRRHSSKNVPRARAPYYPWGFEPNCRRSTQLPNESPS
jgi:hypothetical protein